MNNEREIGHLVTASAPLLHNMSVAPKTTIIHNGTSNYVGGRVAFALPPLELACPDEHEARHEPGSADCLAMHARIPEGATRGECLIDVLNATADRLGLPAVAAVVERRGTGAEDADILTVAAVLAKSSSLVYLRDKTPVISNVLPGRLVQVIVPGGSA